MSMKKIIAGGIFLFLSLCASAYVGYRTGLSNFKFSEYKMKNDYSFGCYLGGFVRDKETAKNIGEAVLVEKNLRGTGPIEVTSEGDSNNRLWVVKEIGDSESGPTKAIVVIYSYGDIKVLTNER